MRCGNVEIRFGDFHISTRGLVPYGATKRDLGPLGNAGRPSIRVSRGFPRNHAPHELRRRGGAISGTIVRATKGRNALVPSFSWRCDSHGAPATSTRR